MTNIITRNTVLLLLSLTSHYAISDTFYQVSAGIGSIDLDITRKHADNATDSSDTQTLSLGAYRRSSLKHAWGAVIEFTRLSDREESLPGSGKINGFRPVNFLYSWNSGLSIELFGGIAKYDWRKSASGYYLGGNVRYRIGDTGLAIAFDSKYYQDLAYDDDFGDTIVQGFNFSSQLIYTF